MDTSRYNYRLPKELIARYPLERGTERLLVANKENGQISHLRFPDIFSHIAPGDVMVLNDTRVIPARLNGRKDTGGKVEVLLLRRIGHADWRCLIKASKGPKEGSAIIFAEDLTAVVVGRQGDEYVISFTDPDHVLRHGSVPLPPYLEREPEEADTRTYQTVYAQHDGSVACPTAGLHFTSEFLKSIESVGIELVKITLHVGLGTFTPIRTKTVEEHLMHEEEYAVTVQAAHALNEAMEQGRRIIAVGTTTTRVLEHLMEEHGRIVPGTGSTKLFISNGFTFKCVDRLLTNFHLPCSTLLVLVCAFGGYELVMKAYQEAITQSYRIFSYGDAMLIV
jgi:S-adenosylmethionine:tRNA ribosyltransferase-isomerase